MSDFHQRFRQSVQTLHNQIDGLAAPDQSLTERKAQTEAALAGITKLAASLADASSGLPAYDQRSYNQSIRELQDKLAITQASHAPKPKFSFKNRHLAAPTSEATSTTTSRSVTPTHLRDTASLTAISQPTPAHAQPAHPQQSEAADHQSNPANINTVNFDGLSNTFKQWPTEDTGQSSSSAADQSSPSCTISDISSSIVFLNPRSWTGVPTLTVSNATSSLIVAACIKGPAWMNGLKDSTVVLSCHQFRMHDSHNVKVYLHCASRPIIEDCSGIKFMSLPSKFQTDDIILRLNMFDQVDDFKWLRAEQSPNWSLGEDDISEETWDLVLSKASKLHDDEQKPVESQSLKRILPG